MTTPESRSPASTRQIAYLAGPMRGYAEYNFPAFHAAAAALRAHGLDVWSPAENDVNQDGFDPAKDTAQPMRHYMKRDLPAVLDADMVCVLPDWEKSQGAQLEVHVARTCGIPVYWAADLSPVSDTSRSETATIQSAQVLQNEMDAARYRWLRRATAGQWELLNDLRLSKSMAYMDDRIDEAMRTDSERGSESK